MKNDSRSETELGKGIEAFLNSLGLTRGYSEVAKSPFFF